MDDKYYICDLEGNYYIGSGEWTNDNLHWSVATAFSKDEAEEIIQNNEWFACELSKQSDLIKAWMIDHSADLDEEWTSMIIEFIVKSEQLTQSYFK